MSKTCIISLQNTKLLGKTFQYDNHYLKNYRERQVFGMMMKKTYQLYDYLI